MECLCIYVYIRPFNRQHLYSSRKLRAVSSRPLVRKQPVKKKDFLSLKSNDKTKKHSSDVPQRIQNVESYDDGWIGGKKFNRKEKLRSKRV